MVGSGEAIKSTSRSESKGLEMWEMGEKVGHREEASSMDRRFNDSRGRFHAAAFK